MLKNWLCHSFWTLSCIALIFDTEHKSMDPNSYIKFDHVSSFQSLSIGLSRKKPDNAISRTQCHINVFCSKKVLAKTNRLFVSKHYIVNLLHKIWNDFSLPSRGFISNLRMVWLMIYVIRLHDYLFRNLVQQNHRFQVCY